MQPDTTHYKKDQETGAYEIYHHYDLSAYNTMALSCTARTAIILHDAAALPALAERIRTEPFFVLSGGSNVLLPSQLDATVILPRFLGLSIIDETADSLLLQVAGGENWHELVLHSIAQSWYGLENLALIPGLAGAAPVQNIGAYGVQLEDVLHSVTAFEWATGEFITLTRSDCDFRYRHSLFKDQPNRYLITAITLKLHKDATRTLTNYGDVATEAAALACAAHRDTITPADVCQAIIAIRSSKLPDPAKLANCGSFFQNPIIPIAQFHALQKDYPTLPSYSVDEAHIKIPAGWLIDQAGLKGTGIAPIMTHTQQALVLTNHAPLSASQRDIEAAQDFIVRTVQDKFGVILVREPVWVNSDGSFQ